MTKLNRIDALLFLVLLSGCCSFNGGSSLNSKNGIDSEHEQRIQESRAADTTSSTILRGYDINGRADLLLEIVVERHGMVYPQGKILRSRVLYDGRGEFDQLDGTQIERREASFSGAQISEIALMLDADAEFFDGSQYVSDSNCIDTSEKKTVRFFTEGSHEEKSVAVIECGTQPVGSRQIPDRLRALLERLDVMLP